MRSAFIRGLWGVPRPDAPTNELKTRVSVVPEIQNWERDSKGIPFQTYAFGTENKALLTSVKIDAKLLDERPEVFDNVTKMWRHKIEIIRRALDDFDEVIWLDWDCIPVKSLPPDFWARIASGQPYKACLKMHKHTHCRWRSDYEHQRYLPSGGFVYIRGADTADWLIRCFDGLGWERASDEDAMGKLGDEILGGWKGAMEYCLNFEPYCCSTKRCSCCPEEIRSKKTDVFRHVS